MKDDLKIPQDILRDFSDALLYGWQNTLNNADEWGEHTDFDFRMVVSK